MGTVVISTEIDKIIEESKAALKDYVVSRGRTYPSDEWVTVARYCKLFGIDNTQTVSNWIKRGIIPEEDTVVLEDLNNIRLIRSKKYNG
ncbi:MAG TPA: hypothetical protein VGN64_05310 [Dyadobacter sp.]|jgi:hypothetical protein|nr:hypothetical protein [Dyadobacter sp.]